MVRDGEASRARILEAVTASPGLSRHALARQTRMAFATVGHHLRVLEERRLVHVDEARWQHAIYAAAAAPRERPWLRVLQDERGLCVLAVMQSAPHIGVYQLSDDLGWSRKVVRAILARLAKDGLVERIGTARPRYRSCEPPESLRAALASGGATAGPCLAPG